MDKGQKTCKILVAEDNSVSRIIIQELLRNLGCTVFTATNGKEALIALEQEEFDLIFMDCEMPEMDGFETTRIIRAGEISNHLVKDIPIVALTAHETEDCRERCLFFGMNDFVSKPITPLSVQNILIRWL